MSHAVLSPSSAERWIHCPPSAKINAEAPRTDTAYTKEGTLAHALCELKGRKYFLGLGPRKYAAELKKLQADEMWQDEMEDYTEDWMDAIKGFDGDFDARPHVAVEQKVEFSDIVPEGFGTCDCVMVGGGLLQVIDFKYGKGVPVSAEGNPQLMLYALGALKAYDMIYDIDTVKLSIVQPRIRREPDSWEVSVDDLNAWAEDVVKPAAALAIGGEGEYREGEWCRFCAIRGSCRARAEANLALARAEFRLPPELEDGEIGDILREGERLESWLADLRKYALNACLDGREIPGWKAVEGRSQRAWTDAEAAFDAARALGVPEAMLYERKPVTLAQLEKAMGKKAFAEGLKDYVTTPPGKPTLVAEKDRRPAITGRTTAEEDFGGAEE